MIDLPFIKCDICKAKLHEYEITDHSQERRIYNMQHAMIICGDCLANFGKNSIIDNIRFEDLPK